MSYDLTINDTLAIRRKSPEGRSWDALNSWMIFYRYTLAQANPWKIAVDQAYLAVYASHESNVPIPAKTDRGPTLGVDYGEQGLTVEIADTAGSLTAKGLTYIKAEDIHAANQAGQLHLFRFDKAKENIDRWIDDTSWTNEFSEPPDNEDAPDGHPFWKRHVQYGEGARYAYSTLVSRGSTGIQALAASLPLRPKSLFATWLKKHDQSPPTLTLVAKDKEAEHWTHDWKGSDVPAGRRADGIAVLCQGAFVALGLSELMAESWHGLLQSGQLAGGIGREFELCRALTDVVSRGAPNPLTVGELSDGRTTSVVPQATGFAQEYFSLRVL